MMPSLGSRGASCCSGHTTIHPESPRRSTATGAISPRKKSNAARTSFSTVPSSISRLVDTLDYVPDDSFLDSIPEREWRLLAALARKRNENDERERLADQFNRMWQKEKDERENVEADTLDQYKRYLHAKREQEHSFLDYMRFQRSMEQQMKRDQVLHGIRHKERRSANLLAWRDDKKAAEILNKAIEGEARAQLAADRRACLSEAEQWRRRIELLDTQIKADEAKRRRTAILKDASQRLAISNALTMWETSLQREETYAAEANRRASFAAHAALTEARSTRILRSREARLARARKLAAITAQMREAVKCTGGRS